VIGVYEFLLSPRSALGIEGVPAIFRGDRISELVYGLVLTHYLLEPSPSACRAPLSAVRPPAADCAAARPQRRGGHVRRGADGRRRLYLIAPLFSSSPSTQPLTSLGDDSLNASYFEVSRHSSFLVAAASGRAGLAVLPGGLRERTLPRRPHRRDVVAAVAGAVGTPVACRNTSPLRSTHAAAAEGERFRGVEVAGTVRVRDNSRPFCR